MVKSTQQQREYLGKIILDFGKVTGIDVTIILQQKAIERSQGNILTAQALMQAAAEIEAVMANPDQLQEFIKLHNIAVPISPAP